MRDEIQQEGLQLSKKNMNTSALVAVLYMYALRTKLCLALNGGLGMTEIFHALLQIICTALLATTGVK
jgi:hypothetical protein